MKDLLETTIGRMKKKMTNDYLLESIDLDNERACSTKYFCRKLDFYENKNNTVGWIPS